MLPWAIANQNTQDAFDMRLGASDLIIQPVLMYDIPKRREGRSWRNWGGVQTEEAVKQEADNINRELKGLCGSAEFGMQSLDVVKAANPQETGVLKDTKADAIIIYAAGGWMNTLDALFDLGKPVIVFIRQSSGPYYLWDEIIHPRYLRSHTDQLSHPVMDVNDVVVDDTNEMLWRLRSLYGLKNTLGRRIICIGGPGGWSTPKAPERARERFQLDMVTVGIPELNAMIEAGRKNGSLMDQCEKQAASYLKPKDVTLVTSKETVREAFLLRKLFGDLMTEHDACAITTNNCMGSYAGIMPCLTIGLVNDSGQMAFCESDFVVIPSGILMHFISGKPSYLCNPNYPHDGRMLFAHCAAPRRMDGENLEPVKIITHFESDHGAASHVGFQMGQLVTVLKPDFEAKNWLAFTGTVIGTPELPTCRGQIELRLDADTQDVLENMRGFHCMLAYGDYTKDVAYAAKKVGINVQIL
jgi:L-fucose isomerase-like protein